MPAPSTETLHVSAVAIDGRGVLIGGRSGSGKSDLALRLIDRGAALVSDDYTVLTRTGDVLIAQPPTTIAGRMEVRGLGVVDMPCVERIEVALLVQLGYEPDRMPEPRRRRIAGVDVPEIALDPLPPSAPIKVELALRHLATPA